MEQEPLVWTEKYRPRNLDEVIDQQEVVSRLKAYVKAGNMPHMLFAGPAGTGKTTCAIALARELYGERWRDNLRETNASVAPGTPCLVREGGEVRPTTFGALGDEWFADGEGKYRRLGGVEILSLDRQGGVRFLPATLLSRHRVGELVRIGYAGGSVETSPDHSVVVPHGAGGLVPKRAAELRVGDTLVGLPGELPDGGPGPPRPVAVTRLERVPYGGYVYDVSVPDAQVFWGGRRPVLLHNSDERGLEVVRTRIKEYARLAPMGADVPFKIIFLDEADNLTADAQAALRRTMEMYTKTTRFILSCNYSSRIIEPIQSRTAVFRFRPLRPEDMEKYAQRIAKGEGLRITKDGMEALVYLARGDLRRLTNALQVAAASTRTIDADALYKAASTARPEEVRRLIETSLGGDFLEARNLLDTLLVEYGLSGEDILRQIHRAVFDLAIPDEYKVKLVDRIGEAEFRVVEGSNERIQLEALLAAFVVVGQEMRKR